MANTHLVGKRTHVLPKASVVNHYVYLCSFITKADLEQFFSLTKPSKCSSESCNSMNFTPLSDTGM